MFDELVAIKNNQFPNPMIPYEVKSDERFQREQSLANRINNFSAEKKTELDRIKATSQEYHKKLAELNLKDQNFGKNPPNAFLGTLIMILFFPAFAMGYIMNIGQYTWVNSFVRKKIKTVHFKNSIRFGFMMLINIIICFIA